MNRHSQLAERIDVESVFFNSQPRLRACKRSERVAEPVLDQTDIENLIGALDDTRNAAAASLLAYSGAQTVSGIIARLVVASDEEQFVLQTFIHAALAEHSRINAAE